jgi:hypothetical protein
VESKGVVFAASIVGIPFDAEVLLAKLKSGAAIADLLKQGYATAAA